MGRHGKRTNKEVVNAICTPLDRTCSESALHADLITSLTDLPGHDRRYAIDSGRIRSELSWSLRHDVEQGLTESLRWYVYQREWCTKVLALAGYN